ncbi:MAG: Gfo/Idh/MocA family oxidoreductase, partial [Oscillospiraceae bacterium]|nr:Gfo/Idh/MocA family oxidoreductase [Oscillospiraceae bacterium]MBQ8612580.1 Gfo/Idh/MocA family oxidoreductase [Oscillospiraceae bacterium]
MKPVRIGIIGIGNMGSAHVQSIGEGHIKGLYLSAVADIDPTRLAWVKGRFPAVQCFDTAQALLDSGTVDAIIIATPHWLHPEIAIQAMERGLHVLTEKPAGVAVSQVQRMIEVHKRTGKVFGIMFNQRTNPLFAKARQMVQSGELGHPKRLVWIITNWYRNQGYYDSGAWRASWRGEGGGVLLNQAPHNLDLWQWIFGMPKRVCAFCTEGKYHNIEVEDDATIYAEYENGAVATFITTTGEYPGTNRLEISGDRGKLVLEEGVLKHWKLDGSEREFCFN